MLVYGLLGTIWSWSLGTFIYAIIREYNKRK